MVETQCGNNSTKGHTKADIVITEGRTRDNGPSQSRCIVESNR